MRKPSQYIKRLKAHIRTDRKSFILYSILRVLVLLTMVRCLMTRNYESTMVCVLSLGLLLMPSFFETSLNIQIPTAFEMTIYLFIFAAEILGEINRFYVLIPGWDTMLHTINGFLCAVVGFSLVDLLNQRSEGIKLSPLYVTIVAFCFSMTIGVLWEFLEFGADSLLHLDAQKDFIVRSFSSVTLDPSQTGSLVRVSDITETVIHTASGQTYRIENGYLDIGILDTMKDLFVNFLGAIVCSILGYLYITGRSRGKTKQDLSAKLVIHKLRDTPDA